MTAVESAQENDAGSVDARIFGRMQYGITPDHRFWGMVQDWVSEGNTIAGYVEPDAPDPLTIEINPFQFDAMLRILGITRAAIEAQIDAVIADPTENALAKSRLYNATSYRRSHPLFSELAPGLGLTGDDIDAAWPAAVAFR